MSPRLEPGHQLRSSKSSLFALESSTLGESPPPAPRACFGRDEPTEKIIGLAETIKPVALIGSGGIGKTSQLSSITIASRRSFGITDDSSVATSSQLLVPILSAYRRR